MNGPADKPGSIGVASTAHLPYEPLSLAGSVLCHPCGTIQATGFTYCRECLRPLVQNYPKPPLDLE